MIMFGINEDAYNNDNVHEYTIETKYLQNWQKHSLLSVLIDIINYIKTPL
jgi:hypothetical protein